MKENLKNKSIGIFDSGLGGLTVVKEIIKLLPNEDIVYFGDTARVPYGTKSPKTITHFAIQDANFLMSMGVKIIVVACNTASSNSLNVLKDKFPVPVIGVIEPGIEGAIKYTKTKSIGVIGTKATISSGSYQNILKNMGYKVKDKACPLFVPIVEEGWVNHKVARITAEEYLKDIKNDIDTLILGCTHYPLLKETIQKVVGENVKIVNSGYETALKVKEILEKENLLKENGIGNYRFFVSDITDNFKETAERFLNREIDKIEIIDIEKY